jgi:hypothetical protein
MKPITTKQTVVDYLKKQKLDIEVFDEMPTDKTNVRHGIYVSNFMIASTSVQSQGFGCGQVTNVVEELEILLVSVQDDKKLLPADDAITEIPKTLVGYSSITFTVGLEFLNRAEYRTYNFDLNRIE